MITGLSTIPADVSDVEYEQETENWNDASAGVPKGDFASSRQPRCEIVLLLSVFTFEWITHDLQLIHTTTNAVAGRCVFDVAHCTADWALRLSVGNSEKRVSDHRCLMGGPPNQRPLMKTWIKRKTQMVNPATTPSPHPSPEP